jgi:hypothetical protein
MPKDPRGRHSPADRFGEAAVGDCNGSVFFLVAIACILTAVLAAVGTLGLSPAIEKIADRVIKGACIVALISVVLAALFLLWPH